MHPEVEHYFQTLPPDILALLTKIRTAILETIPNVAESFAYNMPAYKFKDKPLVYFAAFKNHIGFYATPSAHAYFTKELLPYKKGKGSVQFPFNNPIPFALIQKMILFKVKEIEGLASN